MSGTPVNTFYAEGVVHAVQPPQTLSNGVPIQTVEVDITDGLDHKRNVVPFSIRLDRRELPEGFSIGDVVRVQFRLGSYRFGPDRKYVGANLRMGNIEVLHRADDYRRAAEEIDELYGHLVQIEQNRRNNAR